MSLNPKSHLSPEPGSYLAQEQESAVDEKLIDARMLALLKPMHDSNPSWGPLFIRHPGDVRRDVFYERFD